MDKEKPSEELTIQKNDYVASAAKAALGMVPFVGALLTELAGTIIPNQRIDRIAKFAEVVEQKLSELEQDFVRSQLNNEHFADLLEEGLRQAARSLSEERREHIANLIANSLSSDDIEYVESKHLLRILGEINDIEIIWLKYHHDALYGGDEDLWEKHEDILQPIMAYVGASQQVFDKNTLQNSYKDHLVQLGLLAQQYRMDGSTGFPQVNTISGGYEIADYRITELGSFLVRHISTIEDETEGIEDKDSAVIAE